MTGMLRRNIMLQHDLEVAKKEGDSKLVYALAIVMGLDPEEQLYDMIVIGRKIEEKLAKAGWAEVSPA